jgi:hypothetical protein
MPPLDYSFACERLYTETAARVATEAFANVQFTCEFFALLCGEHKVVANESTIQLARMNQFHFMSKNIKCESSQGRIAKSLVRSMHWIASSLALLAMTKKRRTHRFEITSEATFVVTVMPGTPFLNGYCRA